MHAFRHAESQRRQVWPPEPGFFGFALVRKAWRVPCRIIRTEAGLWQAEIDDVLNPAHHDPAHAEGVAMLWHGGVKIPESDYRWLCAVREWAKANAPEHPALSPRKAIDPRRLTPLAPPASALLHAY